MPDETIISTSEVAIVEAPAKPTKHAGGRPPSHGAYSQRTLVELTKTKIAEVYAIMEGERLAIAPSDKIYVTMLGRLLAQLETLDHWFEINGYLRNADRGEPWPALQHYLNIAKQASRMLEALGMTPTARSRLGHQLVSTEDIASRILKSKNEDNSHD